MNFVYITIVTVAVYSSLPLVSAECVDKNRYCYLVKNYRGMCNKDKSLIIKSNCQLSCGFCSSKGNFMFYINLIEKYDFITI